MAIANGLEIVPDNSVLCIEENSGNIKSIYALYAASEKAAKGEMVSYLTLQTKEELIGQMNRFRIPLRDSLRIVEISPAHAKLDVLSQIENIHGPLLIIDPFAVFFADDSIKDLTTFMFDLIRKSRKGTTVLLLIDIGVFPERLEQLVRAMSDGIIQFVVVPEGDKLNKYINIPKMRGSFPRDKMLPFTLNEEGLMIDTRERHG
jgi:archaellum biogenesis ATPase FlaH